MTNSHFYFMKLALEQAKIAAQENEVPVGVVITLNNKVISAAYNKKESLCSALKHAELIAISEASKKLNRWRLNDCLLYSTLEPCIMCFGAINQSRIGTLIYGAKDKKGGAVDNGFGLNGHKLFHHKIKVIPGVLESECSSVLKKFFKTKR